MTCWLAAGWCGAAAVGASSATPGWCRSRRPRLTICGPRISRASSALGMSLGLRPSNQRWNAALARAASPKACRSVISASAARTNSRVHSPRGGTRRSAGRVGISPSAVRRGSCGALRHSSEDRSCSKVCSPVARVCAASQSCSSFAIASAELNPWSVSSVNERPIACPSSTYFGVKRLAKSAQRAAILSRS